MKIFLASPKIVLTASALIICFLYLASINQYETFVPKINDDLTDVQVTSQELTSELLRLRAGFGTNYDDISAKVFSLGMTVDKLKTDIEQKNASLSSVEKATRFLNRDQSLSLNINIESLAQLVKEQESSIDQFKTDFSVYRNARLIKLQLISEIWYSEPHVPIWDKKLSELELALLKGNRVEGGEQHHSEVERIIEELLLIATNSQTKESLNFINIHHNNASKYYSLIKSNMVVFLNNHENIIEYIAKNKENLINQYKEVRNSTIKYTYASIVMTIFILLYGAWQAIRAIKYSREVEKQKENLETTVKQRTSELETREAFFRGITETATDPIFLVDQSNHIGFVNEATEKVFGYKSLELLGRPISLLLPSVSNMEGLIAETGGEITGKTNDDKTLSLKVSVSKIDLVGGLKHYTCIVHDLTDIKSLEKELATSQKLEAVGQLAAGIAHEINTPSQFISDNLLFMKESVDELFDLVGDLDTIFEEDKKEIIYKKYQELIEQADVGFLKEEIPSALDQSYDGINRIAKIVRAMKDYAHPGESMEVSDINHAIQSTITISKSEWKYLAELETDFANDLPLVECVVSDINQVVLNMVVNAAHAIGEKYEDSENKLGKICVSTACAGENILITIEDNGNGMPEHIQAKVFDPFFTTKSVGKGTGQGLSIAHNIIVNKHGGELSLESKQGEGTKFYIYVPIKQKQQEENAELNNVA